MPERENERRRRRGGEEWGGGTPLPMQLRGLGKRRELPQRGPGGIPAENEFCALYFIKKPSGERKIQHVCRVF